MAEFLLSAFRELEENLGTVMQRLDRSTRQTLKEQESKIHQYELRARSLAKTRLLVEKEKLQNRESRIMMTSKNRVKSEYTGLDVMEKRLKKNFADFLRTQTEKLENREVLLRQLDPKAILRRGYTRTELAGKPIHLAQIKLGDQIETFSQDQKISSTITQIDLK